jgi:rhodanese-related sulfurtransferase
MTAKYMMIVFLMTEFGLRARVQVDLTNIPTISWQELTKNLDKTSKKDPYRWYVINVLPKDICTDCSIPGSINIPTHLLTKKLQNWPKDRKIVLYCVGQSCPLSKYAYQSLKALGFQNLVVLDGGMRSWKKNMMPTLGRCRFGYLYE